jgi:ribosomal protein S18 acetylase RimI-like enzyme
MRSYLCPGKVFARGMRLAQQRERNLVIDILAESFDANKSVNYVVKQDGKRRRRVRGLMEYSYNVCNSFGDVWITDDSQACALVLFPDEKKTSLSTILWDVKLAISVIGIKRVSEVIKREARIKAHHPKERFAYLWFIGVKPSSQNKQIGTTLLKGLIGRYASQGKPIYLETSVERNLPWYRKHNFEIFKTLQLTYSLFLLRRII